ncbi:SurA N-terminal domain-containing protein [Xanthobacter sp. KR7-225]|uniref:peptidylprolyl isomerase n=1 Tax=Xanthobacter sp. KR7-225 TaxID=3156613 RepID=UPI0032B5EE3B
MALQTLRKGASGWIAKIFLVVLTLSFLVWGIADVFRGFGASSVASVGGTDISANEFRARYLEQVQQIGRRTGRGLSPEQARALGVDRQVLNQMIADATLEAEGKRLGLAVSNAQVADAIAANPAYRRPGAAAFDPAYFNQLLRQNSLTEARFVQLERARMLRDQMIQSLGTGLAVPAVLVDAVHRYESEARDATYILVTAEAAGEQPAPTEDQLRAFYDAHKITFRAPEYRKVSVLALTPEALAAHVAVSAEDARAFYDREQVSFGTPERREVRQIVFPTPEDAAAASDKIKAGASFDDIAAARGLKPTDTDLGLVAKSAILDPKIAEVAFLIVPGGTSAPIEGRFGFALVNVPRAEPASRKPFDEVKSEIETELALAKARRELLDQHDAVEDERASGSTLGEIAKKLSLPLSVIDAVDRSGRDPAGNPVEIPGRAEVVSGAFAAPVGVETDTIQLPGNGGFVWFQTDAVIPARDRTFEEARAEVEARFKQEALAKAVEAKAQALFDQAKAGTLLAQVAGGADLPLKVAEGLRRGRATPPFSVEAITEVFSAKDGGVGLAPAAEAPDRVVFQVSKITVPPEGPQDQQIAAQLSAQMENDLLVQYLGALQQQFGVTVNQRVLSQSVGAGAGS